MFTEKLISAVSEESIEKACTYSENPEDLRSLFGNINLSPKPLEIAYISTGIREYFDEDKKPRQCIEVTISRNGREITFPFGMSIYDTETIEAIQKVTLFFEGWCKYRGEKFYSNRHSSKLLKRIQSDYKEIRLSILYSILCTVRSEFFCPPIFEDFCSDYGYDTDSRKAFDTWQECLKLSQKFHSIFTEKEMENFPS